MIRKSNYDEINFNELYKAQRLKSSFTSKSVKDWDEKAEAMNKKVHESIYVQDFLSRVDLEGVDSVLDFACGPGTLSLKVAPKVGKVIACDYSEKMLEFAKFNAQRLNLANIKTQKKAFEDDWSDIEVCDVVFASRCLEVDCLQDVLKKLISKARKAVYLTFKVGASFVDDEILTAMGKEVEPKPDYIYLLNIIAQLGYLPRLDFIRSENVHNIAQNADELVDKITWGIGSELSEAEKERLREFFTNGYKEYVSKRKFILWAFIKIEL